MIAPIRARYCVENGRIISREFENEDVPAGAVAELFVRLDEKGLKGRTYGEKRTAENRKEYSDNALALS